MSNFKKLAAAVAAGIVLAAGAVGAAQSVSVDDAKANSVKKAALANSV